MSPMMIKALFSTLGITPEEIIAPIAKAVQDIEDFKRIALDIRARLIRIENHLNINSDCDVPTVFLSETQVIEGEYNDRETAN